MLMLQLGSRRRVALFLGNTQCGMKGQGARGLQINLKWFRKKHQENDKAMWENVDTQGSWVKVYGSLCLSAPFL